MEPCTFLSRPEKCFPKKISYIFSTCSEKASYILSKKAPYFLETEHAYIF